MVDPMKHLASALFATALFLLSGLPTTGAADPTTAPAGRILFGMDAGSIKAQADNGVAPDLATFWIGPWTLTSGWGGPDAQLTQMANAGVTPAIHFYYWGDDISQSCLENGCYSNLHKAQKDKAGWQTLAQQLVDHLNAKMGGRTVLIFLETEFNKGNVATYEALDGYLAEKANFIKSHYTGAKIVMALGNWNNAAWTTWDRTAAASDYTGIQGMRGSTKGTQADYLALYNATMTGVKRLQTLFQKPIVLQDIALSSYPEPGYLQTQATSLGKFFVGINDLRAEGVRAIVYRSWKDSPNMDTANYYGMAERYWGLANATAAKPAADIWIKGVKAERATTPTTSGTGTTTGTPPPATTPGTTTPPTTSSPPPAPPTPPPNRAPTASFATNVVGRAVSFDASTSADPEGAALSYTWNFGDGTSATGKTAQHTYTTPGARTVTLTVSDGTLSANVAQSVTAINRAPQPSFTTTSNLWLLKFDATGSKDLDGDALQYTWEFGDGGTATGATAGHFYFPGAYTVKLTVRDAWNSAVLTKTLQVLV